METKLHIHVTKKHINEAIRRDSYHCMIADAIHSADPEAKYVSVDLQKISWSNLKKGERYTCLTPLKAQSALLSFDQGKPVSPLRCTVRSIKVDKVGWAAHHPGQSRKGKKYNKTGIRRRKPRAHREFGLKAFVK